MRPIIRNLARLAASESGLAEREMFGQKKSARRISWPRFAVMKVAREQGRTYQMIADHLGMSDHTSVTHGVKRAAEIELFDPVIAKLIVTLRESL